MRNRMYGGVRGRKTKVGRKLLRFPPTRLANSPGGTTTIPLPFLWQNSMALLMAAALSVVPSGTAPNESMETMTLMLNKRLIMAVFNSWFIFSLAWRTGCSRRGVVCAPAVGRAPLGFPFMPHWAARVVCMVRERKKRASLMVASLALCLQDGAAPACQKAAGAGLSGYVISSAARPAPRCRGR